MHSCTIMVHTTAHLCFLQGFLTNTHTRLRVLTCSASAGSFSKNCTTQYASCAWYCARPLVLWRGISTFTRNCLCSAFSGSAKPLMMLGEGGGEGEGEGRGDSHLLLEHTYTGDWGIFAT